MEKDMIVKLIVVHFIIFRNPFFIFNLSFWSKKKNFKFYSFFLLCKWYKRPQASHLMYVIFIFTPKINMMICKNECGVFHETQKH